MCHKSSTDIFIDKFRVVNSTKTIGWVIARLVPVDQQKLISTDITINK